MFPGVYLAKKPELRARQTGKRNGISPTSALLELLLIAGERLIIYEMRQRSDPMMDCIETARTVVGAVLVHIPIFATNHLPSMSPTKDLQSLPTLKSL